MAPDGLENESRSRMIQLAGSPEKIGGLWGSLNRDSVVAHLDRYVDCAASRGIRKRTLIQRSERFIELARELAPHWLEEAHAVAVEAAVDEGLYISYIANSYRDLYAQGECTSYSLSPQYARDGGIFFHKNRDNVPREQSGFILGSLVPGVNRFIAISDASVIACMAMVNERGLCGSADTGGPDPEVPRYRGLMNTFILRHIAETAGTCEEALQIVRKMVASGVYAGGSKTGTHWLFVDRNGHRIEIGNNSRKVSYQYHNEKVYFSARDASAATARLRRARKPVDFLRFHGISRDPSICFDRSIAGISVEVDRDHPETLTGAWISLPAKAIAFPLLMGGSGTPLPLLNGCVYSRFSAIDDRGAWQRREREIMESQRGLESRILGIMDRDGLSMSEAIDDWVGKTSSMNLSLTG